MSRNTDGSGDAQETRRRDFEAGMEFWRARDAYRMQSVLIGSWTVFCGGAVLLHWMNGHVGSAIEVGGIWFLGYWGVPRLLRLIRREAEHGMKTAGHWAGQKIYAWK